MRLNLTRTIGVAAAALLVTSALAFAQKSPSICKDGTTSTSSGRGACSGHGGVDTEASAAARKAEKDAAKSARKVAKDVKVRGAEVRNAAKSAKRAKSSICGDGTVSETTGRGACSGHGGVKREETMKAGSPVSPPIVSQPTPRASNRARERANPRSAVIAGNGSAEDTNPSGAIAKCKDGLYSHARGRRGACGHHGGVATWM